jgi:hypothetical protein
MNGRIRIGLFLASALMLPAQTLAAQYVYPMRGQEPETQVRDEAHCSDWAWRESGFDPLAPPPQTAVAAPVTGSGARARGAAGGALIGGVAGGSAGAGAATGALVGGLARRAANHRAAANANAANANQYAAHQAAYYRARRACLTGRGYTVG